VALRDDDGPETRGGNPRRDTFRPNTADMKPLDIYCNAALPADAEAKFAAGIEGHRWLRPSGGPVGVLGRAGPDPRVDEADVVFGQPDPAQVASSGRVAWVHLISAGYTAFDTPAIREGFRARRAALTKSSLVFDEPCALHVLAFLCAEARQLRDAFEDQRGARAWPQLALRAKSRILRDELVTIVGFGSIARHLVQLLEPLGLRIQAIRRQVAGDEGVPTFALGSPEAAQALGRADHVIDILPASPGTEGFFDAARLESLKRGAVFYNIGRGTTVDQRALAAALHSGQLAAAYLDVTDPEPLPVDHPLWSAPSCTITPHIAGGHATEWVRLVHHFLDNLVRYTAGQPLLDRVW